MATDFHTRAQGHADRAHLRKLLEMFEEKRFDICTVRAALESKGLSWDTEDFVTLRKFHCVRWEDIDPKFAQELKAKALETCGYPAYMISGAEIIDVEATEVRGEPLLVTGSVLNKTPGRRYQ